MKTEENWINLAHDNVYQITNINSEYILVDNIELAIRILKSTDNDFHQYQVIPKDEVEEFFEGEQIILSTWEEYQIVMGRPIDDKTFLQKRQIAKEKHSKRIKAELIMRRDNDISEINIKKL